MGAQLAEKVVQPAINPEHLAYCPTIDLIAVGGVDEHVRVFRLNGQKVFGVQSRKPATKIGRVQWKPNGQLLATAFSDNSLVLTNAHTGKVVHQIDCSAYSKARICCLGWGINFTEGPKVKSQLDKSQGEITLDDLISRNPQAKVPDVVLDLPLNLTFLDVEVSLPKLSPLSSGGIEDDVFSSRASLDTLFQPLTAGSSDAADILIVGFEDGVVHVSIYDFFEIGRFDLQQAGRDLGGSRPLMHCSHPCSTTHSLLTSTSASRQGTLHMVPLDLRLLSNAGRYLSLLASKSTQMYNVLRYVRQAQKQMSSDFKASQELPSRFMGNIEETLQEQRGLDWMQTAYQLVVTGHCIPEVKEWLVDQLGERGHKRWEKATSTGYESVRRLAHENLLPALERFTVIVSRLRGLSKFQVSNVTLGLSTRELDRLLDTVSCLQLVTHRVLIIAGTELRQFQAFSAWLRQEIDIQAIDASSSDTTGKDTNVDHVATLEYIQGAMIRSQLTNPLGLQPPAEQYPSWDLAAEERPLLELYIREHNIVSTKGNSPRKVLPGVDVLIGHLGVQCENIFNRIAETQRRSVRFGDPVSLGQGTSSCMDMKVVVEEVPRENVATYVVLGSSTERDDVRIYRISVEVVNGVSVTNSVEQAVIRTAGWNIKDVRFVDDEELILAACNQDSSRLFKVCYLKLADHPLGLQYKIVDTDNAKGPEATVADMRQSGIDLSNERQCRACTWQEFPAGVSWTPERIEVNGRKGRRAICVMAQDRFHYRIFDLDSPSGADAAEEIATEGSDDMKC